MRHICTFAGFVAATLLASAAQADAMRCGSKLVSDGDTQSEVRNFCGDPADIQTRTILRRAYDYRFGRRVYLGDNVLEVPVEVWTYNFGPYKLQRRVVFVNGLIDEIETLGYGYHEKRAAE